MTSRSIAALLLLALPCSGCASAGGDGDASTADPALPETAIAAPPAAAPQAAAAPLTHRDLAAIWNDPIFKRQFIASYGVNSEIEPRVTPDEAELLEKLHPLMANDLKAAEELLQDEMEPDCSALLDFTLGGIRLQQERPEEALANYKTAVEKFPGFQRAWRNLGLVAVRGGDLDGAITAFTRMIELGGGDAYAYGLLGYAYSAKQDYQPAEASYRNALLLQPDNTEWRLGLTRCVFKQQKHEDAAALLDVLIERYPEKPDFWLLQAQAYLGMKRPLDAARDLEAVDRLGKATADDLHALGDLYASEQLFELGARACKRAIDRDPAQPLARSLRFVEVLAMRGASEQARAVVSHLHQACDARMSEEDRRKLLKLEARLAMAEGGGTPETATLLEEIVKLDPLDGEALLLLGDYANRQGDTNRAILHYERAAGIERFEGDAKIRHAQALVATSRFADAIPLLRRAQELRPREDVARYLEQVERIARTRK
jgi:tetratricopeptide (TPR) repeat protein